MNLCCWPKTTKILNFVVISISQIVPNICIERFLGTLENNNRPNFLKKQTTKTQENSSDSKTTFVFVFLPHRSRQNCSEFDRRQQPQDDGCEQQRVPAEERTRWRHLPSQVRAKLVPVPPRLLLGHERPTLRCSGRHSLQNYFFALKLGNFTLLGGPFCHLHS